LTTRNVRCVTPGESITAVLLQLDVRAAGDADVLLACGGTSPGTGRVDRLAEALGVRAGLSALHAVALAPRFQCHGPFVQPLPAFAQRVLEGRIRPGDEAVQRRGDVDDRSHVNLLVSSLGRPTEAKLLAA
jgi:hypothetical protein